jgi:Flp pilus assembly protein TadG
MLKVNSKFKRVQVRDQQSGAVMVETLIGALVFLGFFAFIFDFGILVHRHALLVDATIKTVQQVSRDPAAGESVAVLQEKLTGAFNVNAERLYTNSRSGMKIVDAQLSDCEYQEITVVTEWDAPCAMCILGKFRTKLHAKGIGKLEVPSSSLGCDKVV